MHRFHVIRLTRRAVGGLSLALLALGAARARADVVHPTPEDVASFASASDLALSPDGRTLVYTLEWAHFDPTAKPAEGDTRAGWTRERQLWLLDVNGGHPRQLTYGADGSGSPRWSPDGRTIAFLRTHEDKATLQTLSLDGGEAETVALGALEPTAFRWSPDGRWLAFTAEVPRSPTERDAVWRTGGVERWGEDWRPAALYVVPRAGGAPRRVSQASEHVVAFEWSPDGGHFAVLTASSSDPYQVALLLTPRVISARDGALERVLDAEPRYFEALAWSPDGAHVALTTTRSTLTMVNVVDVCDVASGRMRTLSPTLDVTFGPIAWLPDARGIVAVERQRMETRLVRLGLDGSTPQDLGLRDRVIEGDVLVGDGGRSLVFLSGFSDRPLTPTAFDVALAKTRALTELNPQVGGWRLGTDEVVRWRDADGVDIEGLLTRPPGERSGAHTPLIVMPHGGPDDVTTRHFSAMTQYFAAHGYAVLRPNYRGSLGYGREFYAANRGRFGEIETQDIESGVDTLVASGRADAARLFFGGWSWGGYLSVWTLTHQTRYRAIVVGAGVSDVAFSYSLSDINHGRAAQWEFKGDPWRQTENFDRVNPIRFARNARTPTLILHGQSDSRVPFPESVALYRALEDVGCPVTFYAYPREPHGFVEPAHVTHMLRVWLDWYDTHTPGRTTRR